MRKPDGLSAEEALRCRPSFSGLLSPGDVPLQSSFPSMRRKSALPKHIGRSNAVIDDDEDEDEDEVDNSAELLADADVPILVTPTAYEDEEPEYLKPVCAARTPTPAPKNGPTTISSNGHSNKASAMKESKPVARRVSPRKGGNTLHPPPAKKPIPNIGWGRMLPNGANPQFVARPTSATNGPDRDALTDLPLDNGQTGIERGKPPNKFGAKIDKAAIRRASMAV